MSGSILKQLTIEHLRGSVRPFSLSFANGKKLTLVYGENATGKTTICDAFEFLGKGKVSSLENRGLGKTTRYWHSVGRSSADIIVSLETENSACIARVQQGEVVVVPPEVRPKTEVLRRGQILRLLDAKPAERYAEISRFLDVSAVESSEASLRELIRALSSNRETAVARVLENQNSLNDFWTEAGRPAGDALVWARGESVRGTATLELEIEGLNRLRNAYQRVAEYPEWLDSAAEAIGTAQAAADNASKEFEKHLGMMAEGSGDLIRLLEAAESYLSKHPAPASCPVCESDEKILGLTQRVSERIRDSSLLQAAAREKRAADERVQAALHKLEELEGSLAKHSTEFEAARNAHEWHPGTPLPGTPCPTIRADLRKWLSNTTQLPTTWRVAETERYDKKQFLSTLKRALETYETNVQAQKDLDRLLPRLERALEIVEEERRKFTDGVLAQIAGRVGTLYEAVHPGEGLNKISLELDPKRRASLEIGANFCGHATAPPQAYYSQSHLDTLGICVFLALAELDQPAQTILVMDDVLASVDEPHVERLINVLYAEALTFRHCIITTHYRPWKEKLRWGWLRHGQCHFVELGKWSETGGLSTTDSIPEVDRLRKLLADSPVDSQSVCAKAGVILEATLEFLTQAYECPVPRRRNALYTLGDLLKSIDKKLRKALKVEVLKTDEQNGLTSYESHILGPELDELARIAQARNVFGCHFSALSFELLDSDAIGFGNHVLRLAEVLIDPDQGWPRSDKSGSYWATAGETRRLHPLRQPE